MKNWKAISEITDENLRLLMIKTEGSLELEKLERGFPEFFTDRKPFFEIPPISYLLKLLGEASSRDKVKKILLDLSIPVETLCFSGSCRGSITGVSYSEGGYDTTANGWGEYFYRSTARLGDIIEYKGAQWFVVRNGYSAGSGWCFASHSLFLIPKSVYEK